MNVERVRVGEILRLERIPVQPDPTVEYVSIGVRSFGKGIFHYEPKLGSQLGSLRFFEVQPDRLVVSNIKGWEGAIAISSTSDAGCLASNRFLTYVPLDDRIDVGWARWYFLSDAGISLIQRASPGSADRNRTLAIERFEALEIPLPPVDDQRRVAQSLSSMSHRVAGSAIPLAAASETVFQALGESLLKDAVNDLRHRTKECAALGDLGRWSSGGTPSAKEPAYYGGDTPWAVIGDLNDGFVYRTERTITDLGLADSSAKVVPVGTLMVAMYGSIGKLGVAGIEMTTNQAIACCQPDLNRVSVLYLASFLRCVRTELVQLGQGGAQQNISQGLLKGVSVPVPDDQTQLEFVSRVSRHLAQSERARALFEHRRALLRSVVPSSLNSSFAGLN